MNKMMLSLLGSTVFGLLATSNPAAAAKPLDGAQYLPQAKIKLAQARTIATHAQAGRIVAEELEHESGGSGLRYSFDIKQGDKVHEVGVDARTGKLLENSVEGPNAD